MVGGRRADRGQGLNNAILDCAQLVKQVQAMAERSAAALGAAVERYEDEVWERGREAVLSSLDNSMAVHDWTTLMESPLVKAGTRQKVERMGRKVEVEEVAGGKGRV